MFHNFLHKILKIPVTMRVRYDHCDVKRPKITIVFLHGIAASCSAWKEVLPPLMKDEDLRKVRFIALDLIGFGKSEKPDWYGYDYASYRKTLTRTLKKLNVHTPLVICGHSMGCLLAVDYAANGDRIVDQLILISPPVIKNSEVGGMRDQIYSKLSCEQEYAVFHVCRQIGITAALVSIDQICPSRAAHNGDLSDGSSGIIKPQPVCPQLIFTTGKKGRQRD